MMVVTLGQIAKIMKISKMTLWRRAKKEGWKSIATVIVKGKQAKAFRIIDLPEDIQIIASSLPAVSQAAAVQLREGARKIALARLGLLRALDAYREAQRRDSLKRPLSEIDREFIKGYNSGLLHPRLYEELGEVSLRSVYRWRSLVGNSNDYLRLVPFWGTRRQDTKLSTDEKDFFMGLLLHPNRVKVGTAIRLTRYYFERKGHQIQASDSAFRRYAEKFKSQHYDRWVLMREGQKALRDKVEPYINRDPSVLNVGDILVADGHRLNFQVINPFTGKPCRATLVGYVDWKSYDLVGYEIMINENTQCIASAMRNSIIRLGKMPLISYQDNGKAFRAKFFTGTDLEESGIYGLFARLGIIPVFAKPYNARSKIIERWFKEFSDTFERLFPSYIGSSIADKPAYMLRNEKLHKALHNEYVPTIEETVVLLEHWLEFHRSQECPHVKGKSIGEVFSEGRGPGVDVNALDDLMMDARITRIGRNGIRFLGADYYDDNLYGLKEQVIIRYSLFDLSYIKVYAMNGEYICTANRVMPVHPLASHLGTPKDVEALKRNLALQKRAEKKTIQGAKDLLRIGKTAELDWQKVIEITPRIVEKLELEGIALSAIEEHIPDEAVNTGDRQEAAEVARLEPSSRPIFESNIERYEWHLKYGVWTAEDEAWCTWFRTTDEFRMLYTAFQNQAKKAVIDGHNLRIKEMIAQ